MTDEAEATTVDGVLFLTVCGIIMSVVEAFPPK